MLLYKENTDKLSNKVDQYHQDSAVDMLDITLKAQHREKGFEMDEDRFLLCKTNELGFGNWDDLKEAVHTCPDFEFDYFLKTRTVSELSRRVTSLVRLLKGKNSDSCVGTKKAKRKGSSLKQNDEGSGSKRPKN